jgi:3-methyladenine DNA glycosylase AlkD
MKIDYNWNKDNYKKFVEYLIKISENDTKKFNEKIFNTNYKILGIKTPVLKEIAKDISKRDYKEFLSVVGNTYFEEVLIEGFVISNIKDPDLYLEYFNKYIYKIDSWAISDSFIANSKLFKKYDLSNMAYSLILDTREFIIRVGYIILLDHYIDDEHIKDILNIVQKESSYYYVNMAIAWLVAECFIKSRGNTLELLKSKKLSPFVQNKAISKICDSYRITKEDKELVKTYKI